MANDEQRKAQHCENIDGSIRFFRDCPDADVDIDFKLTLRMSSYFELLKLATQSDRNVGEIIGTALEEGGLISSMDI